MAGYDIRVKIYDPADPRLGRHVRHDSRSLNYLAPEQDLATLVSVRHNVFIPMLDQGPLGSCTGNAATANVGSALFWESAGHTVLSPTDAVGDEQFAVGVYSAATALDPWDGQYPPTDTGSDGLSVAKVLLSRGLISGYTHATSLAAVLTALQTQAVIVGTEWRNDMFDPDSSGRIQPTGAVAGGHEYLLDEIDVENKRVWIHNSWGTSWGLSGRAWMTWDDFETLLLADGDCTVFTPLSSPAPTPTPPEPEPVVVDTADETFATSARLYLRKCSPFHRKFQAALRKWLAAKNL